MPVLADLYDSRDHLWTRVGWAGKIYCSSVLDKFLCRERRKSRLNCWADIVLMIEQGPGPIQVSYIILLLCNSAGTDSLDHKKG